MAIPPDEITRLKLMASAEQYEARIYGLCDLCNDHVDEMKHLCRKIHDTDGDVYLTNDERETCSLALELLVAVALYSNAYGGSRPDQV